MSVGFFGIQFAFGLQNANMSAIFKCLGANSDKIPILWLAAPLTGLVVQPIIGHMSDRTWCWFGRRKPYFLIGAIFTSLALILVPQSSALWMAASLLWVLDASTNISMEPFRAFVADLLPIQQRALGYAFQSLFIGLGAVVASSLPWIFHHVFGLYGTVEDGSIPYTIQFSFYIGAAVLLAAIVYTMCTTTEYPPKDIEEFKRLKEESKGIINAIKEMVHSAVNIPSQMKHIALVQLFTWFSYFCLWIYFGVAITRSVFGAADPNHPAFEAGIAWGGLCFAVYNGIAFAFSFALIILSRKFKAKDIHTICLLAGGIGLVSVLFISQKEYLLLSMVGVGVAWASTLSMPYAILSHHIPAKKMGFYMGIFNFSIVIPQIFAAIALMPIVKYVLNNNELYVVALGGSAMIIAAFIAIWVKEEYIQVEETISE